VNTLRRLPNSDPCLTYAERQHRNDARGATRSTESDFAK